MSLSSEAEIARLSAKLAQLSSKFEQAERRAQRLAKENFQLHQRLKRYEPTIAIASPADGSFISSSSTSPDGGAIRTSDTTPSPISDATQSNQLLHHHRAHVGARRRLTPTSSSTQSAGVSLLTPSSTSSSQRSSPGSSGLSPYTFSPSAYPRYSSSGATDSLLALSPVGGAVNADPNETDDERFARELQEQEDLQMMELLALEQPGAFEMSIGESYEELLALDDKARMLERERARARDSSHLINRPPTT